MGDVLAGSHAAWEFDGDSVLIRFERGIRTPKLFQALGERRVPLEALDTVSLTPGRRGTVVLRAVARAGADPLMDAASGQLKEGCDPYRLVLPSAQEQQAREQVDELNKLIADRPAPASVRDLVAPPRCRCTSRPTTARRPSTGQRCRSAGLPRARRPRNGRRATRPFR
ncbi:DUF4429 domain-containing protein [Actinomadura keratinilytica]